MFEPLTYPQVPAEEIGWRNELLGTRRELNFTLGDTEVTMQLAAHAGPTDARRVLVTAGGTVWAVSVVNWDRLLFVEQALGIDLLSQLPDEILIAALEAIFQRQLDWLSERTSVECQIAQIVDQLDSQEFPHEIGFRLALPGKSSVSGSIAGDTGAMALLRDLILQAPPLQSDVSSLPLVASVEIGMTQVSAAQLQELRVGDVLIMEISTFRENGRGLVRIPPRSVWKVRVEDESIIFDECVEIAPPAAFGDGVSVNVVAELGRIRLAASQLESLEPGVSIPRVKSEQVTLTCNGRPFASGPLVGLGDCLGVQITAINAERPEPAPLVERLSTSAVEEPAATEEPVGGSDAQAELPEIGEAV